MADSRALSQPGDWMQSEIYQEKACAARKVKFEAAHGGVEN